MDHEDHTAGDGRVQHQPDGDDGDLGIAGIGPAAIVSTGGTSTVFRARERALDRDVAVKVFRPDADRGLTERELRIMGRLSGHSATVPVFSSGRTEDGSSYLVMPFFGRGSLHQLVRERGPLAWREATFLLLPIADTAADLHAAGFVHRDVKPGNVLLSDHLRPHLGDFGISMPVRPEATDRGAVAFTPSFGAPETFDRVVTDPTVDVYSLGATLWALLAGRTPFVDPEGSNTMQDLLGRARSGEAPPLPATVPSHLADLIGRAMSPQPADRPADAGVFAAELRRAVRLSEQDASAVTPLTATNPAFSLSSLSVMDRSILVALVLMVLGLLSVVAAVLT